jgi:hypothetical protein
MLGYSEGLVALSNADGRPPLVVVVGVTDEFLAGSAWAIVSDELPFVSVPLRLTVLAMPSAGTPVQSRVSLLPFAIQRPDAVRGGNILPVDARRLLHPSSWYLTSPEELLDVPLNVPVPIRMPNYILDRYMGLGALVSNPTNTTVRVSLIWEVLYTDAE